LTEFKRYIVHGESCVFELDLATADENVLELRKHNLQRMGYHVRTVAREVDFWHHSSMITVTVHSLYKREKSAARKYYPIPMRSSS